MHCTGHKSKRNMLLFFRALLSQYFRQEPSFPRERGHHPLPLLPSINSLTYDCRINTWRIVIILIKLITISFAKNHSNSTRAHYRLFMPQFSVPSPSEHEFQIFFMNFSGTLFFSFFFLLFLYSFWLRPRSLLQRLPPLRSFLSAGIINASENTIKRTCRQNFSRIKICFELDGLFYMVDDILHTCNGGMERLKGTWAKTKIYVVFYISRQPQFCFRISSFISISRHFKQFITIFKEHLSWKHLVFRWRIGARTRDRASDDWNGMNWGTVDECRVWRVVCVCARLYL